MKIQDIIFFIIFAFMLYKHNPKWAAISGIICLIISIPLFATWIFFTAERLIGYAAAFFLLSIIFHLLSIRKEAK